VTTKFAVQNALNILNEELSEKYALFPLDYPDRTYAHSFALGGETGKQFAIILGKRDEYGNFGAHQTRVITEATPDPGIPGAIWSSSLYRGGKVAKQKQTSKGYPNRITESNQTSFFLENETALRNFIHWYSEGIFPEPILEKEILHVDTIPIELVLSDKDT
jgi:hypothetical protein